MHFFCSGVAKLVARGNVLEVQELLVLLGVESYIISLFRSPGKFSIWRYCHSMPPCRNLPDFKHGSAGASAPPNFLPASDVEKLNVVKIVHS